MRKSNLFVALMEGDATKVERACVLAEHSLVDSATIWECLAAARKLRERDLLSVMRPDDADVIEEFIAIVSTGGVEFSVISQGQLQVRQLRAKRELLESLRIGSPEQIVEALEWARLAGVDSYVDGS